jgi:hypothetical protein
LSASRHRGQGLLSKLTCLNQSLILPDSLSITKFLTSGLCPCSNLFDIHASSGWFWRLFNNRAKLSNLATYSSTVISPCCNVRNSILNLLFIQFYDSNIIYISYSIPNHASSTSMFNQHKHCSNIASNFFLWDSCL